MNDESVVNQVSEERLMLVFLEVLRKDKLVSNEILLASKQSILDYESK